MNHDVWGTVACLVVAGMMCACSPGGAEGLENVITLSGFRNPSFGLDYGLVMVDGPMKGLYSRAVIILDEDGRVLYAEQVPEFTQEPDYDRALESLK